ncbi:MAG: CpaF family protein, partial [Aeromicrobium sp.]
MEQLAPAFADQVRDLVRERRIDPRTDTDAVRRAAVDVIAEHDRRSLTGAVRPVDQPEIVVGQILAEVSGFGPLQQFLDDEEVEEVWINQPDRIFVAREGT